MLKPQITSRTPAHAERQSMAGIAIGPILFIVALLGVLAAAIAAGSGSFAPSTSREAGRSAAAALMTYAEEISNAVQRVRLNNGCDFDTLSFANTIFIRNNGVLNQTLYTNANAPVDYSCDIFRPEGGNVLPRVITPAQISTPHSGSMRTGNPVFVEVNITGYGTSLAEIALQVPHINQQTCYWLNRLVNFGTTDYAPRRSYISSHFDGVDGGAISLSGVYTSQRFFCYSDTAFTTDQDPVSFMAVFVLLVR